MERNELEKITLQDTGLYNSNYSFSNVLRKNNITTVGQLFDDKLMNELFINCHRATRIQLRGFVSLLKYKYLNIPMVNNYVLEDDCQNIGYLRRLGFNEADITKIRDISERFNLYQELESDKIYDLLKGFLIHSNQRLTEIINLNLASYDNEIQDTIEESSDISNENESHTSSEIQAISILRNQLSGLISVRDNLNEQILNLQQQIEILSDKQNKGGIKR